MLFAGAVGAGVVMVVWAVSWRRKNASLAEAPMMPADAEAFCPAAPLRGFWRRPQCWLAIRSRNLETVQEALGLNNPTPCSWSEGLSCDRQLFVSPPLNGWILVVGAELPDPADDVDVCFRFLTELSRRLGHVQMFKTDPLLHHHAWARLESGIVLRAYAWAEKTLWNQGTKTPAENDLGIHCYAYDESASGATWELDDVVANNSEKVQLLAARWSLNPSTIDGRFLERSRGVTGRPARWY